MTDDRLELPLFDTAQRDQEELDELFDDAPSGPESGDEPFLVEEIEVPEPPEAPAPQAPAQRNPRPAGIGARLVAGLTDLLVHIALGGVLIGGSSLLGAPVGLSHLAPLAIVGGIFSFLYHVVPLAFWGRTPGMAVAGLRARSLGDRPLSLPQATKHWLALVLTTATGGLGVLLALGGRSLADRLSGSQTLQH